MKNKIIALLCVILAAVVSFAACDESGAAGGGHKHTFSTVWKSNETEHWHPASCEHGENKGDLAPHADADEDGVCDVCAFECGHDHAFAEAWTNNETHHWHAPTCSHTDEKGSYGLHKDENIDALCDDCSAHVHMLDGAGFCTGCNKEIIPVVETDIGSVVSATTARLNNVISGRVEYTNTITSSVTGQVTTSLAHTSEYLLGTNGTYINRTMLSVDNETVLEENWIPLVNSENITGVTTIKVDGTLTEAQPSSFGPDNLLGYYFAASTLADGYAPETLLYNIYELAVADSINKVFDFNVIHNDALNLYSFSYNILTINTDTAEGEDDGVAYYEVSVSFSYADDYTLLALDVSVDCYTNTLADKAEHDFTYDQATQTITMQANASADNYRYVVGQVKGTRTKIPMNDGSAYTPTDFDLYTDEACTNKADNLTIQIGDNSTELYIGCIPADRFLSFVKNDCSIFVADKNGNKSNGVTAYLVGDVIQIFPAVSGDYILTVTACGKTKTVNINIPVADVKGDKSFTVTTTDQYAFTDSYTFTATKSGKYVFYLPEYNFGVTLDPEGLPLVDFQEYQWVDTDGDGEEDTKLTWFEKNLRTGQSFTFYYSSNTKGATYTIGYDEP